MPNCFSLTRKSDMDSGPVGLNAIDAELCQHFGYRCDEKRWLNEWYNIIGFGLAIGKTFEDLRNDTLENLTRPGENPYEFGDKLNLAIIDYLEANFVPNAWVERKYVS